MSDNGVGGRRGGRRGVGRGSGGRGSGGRGSGGGGSGGRGSGGIGCGGGGGVGRGTGGRGGGSRGGGDRGSGGRGRARGGRGNRGGSAQGAINQAPIDQAVAVEDPLQQVRIQRQATQRRLANLPKEVRQEFVSRKREAQLERMLLPDAPPRKRQMKNKSPERQPCIMVDSEASSSRPVEPEAASDKNKSQGSQPCIMVDSEASSSRPLEPAAASDKHLSPERERSMIDADAASDEPENQEIEIGAEVVLSPNRKQIGTFDHDYDTVMEEWVNLRDSESGNDDLNDDDRTFHQLTHGALTVDTSDLTPAQTNILQTEDDRNDQAIRSIVPDNRDMYTFDWNSDRQTFLGRRETFTETSGPTFEVTDSTRVIDIFDKMFDVDFIDRLCTETNRYASQKINLLKDLDKLSANSRYNRWTPTDRDEMVTFLAIHILQGLYPLPEEEAYFSFNGFGTLKYFPRIMSYNRFLLLKAMLHFADNETSQDTTRLGKIRPVIDYLNNKFSSLYKLSQEIVIDESLLKWHGRLNFAQKIATKAAQVGVKTYELCESSSGYLWKFFVYAGKNKPKVTTDNNADNARPDRHENDDSTPDNNTRPDRHGDNENERPDRHEADDSTPDNNTRPDRHGDDDNARPDRHDDDDNARPDTTDRPDDDRPDDDGPDDDGPDDDGPVTSSGDRPTNATAKIVYDLIEPLLGLGHTLIMDNFYNSPLLLRFLKKNKTDCYGTIRLNREFIPESVKSLKKSDMRQGEVIATYCSDLSVMVWRDANIVSLISTYHKLQIGSKEKYNKLSYKPHIVLDYNKTMGGVDRKDQFLSAQPLERARNQVWYKKLFRRLFNAATYNCFVIFSSVNRRISHRQFRTTLAEELLKRHRQIDLTTEPRLFHPRTNVTGQVTKVATLSTTRPIVESNHFPIRTGSKSTVCRFCKKSRTIWKCEECNTNLCIEICFKAFHK